MFASRSFPSKSLAVGTGLLLVAGLLGCASGPDATAHAEPLKVGTKAPDFNLPATYGRKVKLADYAGKNLIIVFYPMDNTPGCTVQLCALRDEYASFQKLNTEGIASNPNTVASHEQFAKRQNYKFPVLADEDKSMAKAYRTLNPLGFVDRTVYIVDGNGIIRYAKRGMPSNDELRQAIQGFTKPAAKKQ
jgi:peroxiredoxin Q/BCP